MGINFELYKVFYYVAKQLSFSQAAHSLYISQSAVSQAIHQLEQALGCQLFNRTTKRVALTQEGQALFQHVDQAFHLLKSGERSIQNIQSLEQGEIRIGATDTICKYLLLPYLQQFNSQYPHVTIRITNRTSPKCVELLTKGMVDLCIVNLLPGAAYPDLVCHPLQEIHDVFVGGSRFAHLRNRSLDWRELAEYPLLMLERQTATRHHLDHFLHSYHITLSPEIELGSVDLLIEMARSGLGLSLVVEEYLPKHLGDDELFVVATKQKIPARQVGIITNNILPVPVAAQTFISLLPCSELPSSK